MNIFEISCQYGRGTKNTCFVKQNYNGSFWYVVKGGTVVNKTYDNINDGIDVEILNDVDCFTVNKSINTLKQFEKALN